MSTDDTSRGADTGPGSARGGESTGDPLRDLLLALAAQIDVVAGWFGTGAPGPTGRTGPTGTARPAGSGSGGTTAAGAFLGDGSAAAAVGEITSLMQEIGDLLARLIAALITLLEAIAAALRSAPADAGAPPRRYQPIAVRLEAAPQTPPTGASRGHGVVDPTSESEK